MRHTRSVKALHATDRGHRCAKLVKHGALQVKQRREPAGARRDQIPKFVQPCNPLGWRVACDQSGIDGPNGNTRYPMRLAGDFGHFFIDTSLVSPKGTTALQHQGNVFVVEQEVFGFLGSHGRKLFVVFVMYVMYVVRESSNSKAKRQKIKPTA